MTNRNIVITIVIVIAVLGVGLYAYYMPSKTANNQSYDPTVQGKLVLGITDAAAQMGSISSVVVTVSSVDIHNETEGWINVSDQTKDYDLLVLKQSGMVSLLANTNVTAGTYDQVRLNISKVLVVENGTQKEAKLPSGELKIFGNIIVEADKTSTAVFDFIADESLHVTGDGKIIFMPVIKLQKHTQASVEVTANNEVKITGGNRQNDENFGMNENGEVKSNFKVEGDVNIDAGGMIQVGASASVKDEVTLNFGPQNNSGISGTATLTETDGRVRVVIDVKSGILDLLGSGKPAHVHLGSCANLGAVKYSLNSVASGKSTTVINTSMAELKSDLPLAINIHKSAEASDIYVACADITF